MEIRSIRYSDINNNSYSATEKELVYSPVKAEQSSSGFYSGGDPARQTLRPEDWEILEQLVMAILDNESIHLKQRRMLTVLLRVEQADLKRSSLILARSEEQAALEAFLRNRLQLD
jgi:hypothetical protein